MGVEGIAGQADRVVELQRDILTVPLVTNGGMNVEHYSIGNRITVHSTGCLEVPTLMRLWCAITVMAHPAECIALLAISNTVKQQRPSKFRHDLPPTSG
jgi:hypothetical protein